jgi:predicted phage terminase large subunit-like protein
MEPNIELIPPTTPSRGVSTEQLRKLLKTPEGRNKVIAAKCRKSLAFYVRHLWGSIDSAPLIWGWHLDAICLHLQAMYENRLNKLIISIGPGYSKSLITSVFFPTWIWTKHPSYKFITSSSLEKLVFRDSDKSMSLIDSPVYKELFGDGFKMSRTMNSMGYRKNDQNGERICYPTGAGTGFRADLQIIDDPLTVEQSYSSIERKFAQRWFDTTMSNRFVDMHHARRILIAQRTHLEDLSGYLLAKREYQHLCLPTEFDPDRRCVTYDLNGVELFRDPRTEKGELLCPEYFGPVQNEQAKADLGSFGYAAQHDQTPVPIGGGFIKREWFATRHSPLSIVGTELTPWKFEKIVIVLDATLKGKATSDRVCGICAGIKQSRAFILDIIWDQMSWGVTMTKLKALKQLYHADQVAIEDTVNGASIISEIRENPRCEIGCPVIPLATGNKAKEVRIQLSAPYIEAGRIILPYGGFRSTKLGVDEFIDEVTSYPFAPNDDAPDALAWIINHYLTSDSASRFQAYLNAR